jgi:multiple sugar transport system permease protein
VKAPTNQQKPADILQSGFKLSDRAKSFGFYTMLVLLLLFIQLPLLWMLLTAFKTKGTAFRLEFWPRTELFIPEAGNTGFPVVQLEEGAKYLHLEVQAKGSRAVIYSVTTGKGQKLTGDMRFIADGYWTQLIGPLPEFKTLTSKVQSESGVLQEVKAKKPSDFRTVANGQILQLERTKGVLVYQTSDGKNSGLVEAFGSRDYDLVYDTPATKSDPPTYRLQYERPFGEALASLYTFSNFTEILSSEDFNFGRFFFNSLVVAVLSGFLTVVFCTMAGYAFAQKEFHYRDRIFRFLFASMLVPGMIYMVPQFSITLSLGWMDSYQGMIVPHLANVFGLFLMRQYIGQIPKDLFHAAEIDGASEVQVFSNIVIPVCLPIIVTLFILVFVGQWTNFLWQLIVNTGESEFVTLPVGLQQFKGQNANEWEKIMAGACFSILPIAIMFLALQRYFLEGLTAGAVKE